MDVNDIYNALQFLGSNKGLSLKLVALDRNSVGLVKREIIHAMGQPRKMIGDSLYYGDERIDIKTAIRGRSINHQDICGLRETLFYIGWKEGKDEEVLSSCGFNIVSYPTRAIELWKCIKLPVESMLRALQVDGYSEEESVNILFSCGLLC